MLNPSTADEHQLDPTLRRVLGFSQAWGFGGMRIANVFALRSTDPFQLVRAEDPVGPESDHVLQVAAHEAQTVVAAWGAHAVWDDREAKVLEMLAPICALQALRLTRTGHPGHPLYLPGDLEPFTWRERRAA
jgi:hypothetical protein